MKRAFIILIALIIVLFLPSCNSRVPTKGKPVTFYYVQNELAYGTDAPLLVPTTRMVDETENGVDKIIRIYLNGPTSYDCISPFPGGTELVDIYSDGDKAVLILSPHIGTLSPGKQTIAYACLTRTVIELTGVSAVQLRLEHNLVNGAEEATFTLDSFTLFDPMTNIDESK